MYLLNFSYYKAEHSYAFSWNRSRSFISFNLSIDAARQNFFNFFSAQIALCSSFYKKMTRLWTYNSVRGIPMDDLNVVRVDHTTSSSLLYLLDLLALTVFGWTCFVSLFVTSTLPHDCSLYGVDTLWRTIYFSSTTLKN